MTAAFIGPGTVTTASIAGANFGFTLLWALLLSVGLTYVLQEMASRLGVVSGGGLAEALMQSITSPVLKAVSALIVVSAIAIGNAAYEAGNITGVVLGLQQLVGFEGYIWVTAIGVIAGVLLWLGASRLLQSVLISLVAVMSVLFLLTVVFAPVDWLAVSRGLLPSMPSGAELTVIALIGTTIVPYNLFLHASLVAANTKQRPLSIAENRWDTGLSIGIGGIITFAIMACAATAFFEKSIEISVANLAIQLNPILGNYAGWLFGAGLFAAGLTSAITAPLAAAYVVCGLTNKSHQSIWFKGTWLLVLTSGLWFSLLQVKPLTLILFAQAANGLLLPIIACFLLWVCNQSSIMGQASNRFTTNGIAGGAVLMVSLLGGYKLFSLF